MDFNRLMLISGIFSRKSDELDIFPPPPPFPSMMEKEKELMERAKEKGDIKKEQEEKLRQKKEEDRQKEKKKAELERIRFKQEKRKLREQEQKRKWLEKNRKAEERKRHREFRIKEKLERKKPKVHIGHKEKEIEKIPLPREKKFLFGKIFGRKKAFEEELEELDRIGAEPSKRAKGKKLQIPEPEKEAFREEAGKPHDMAKAEEEIQKAIEGIKKKPSKLRKLFERKEKKEERLEIPEIMPSFEEKTDEIGLIEENIHKARLALMDFKFDAAKRTYIEIMRMYNDMDDRKKAKVYQDIKDLYYERKTAEKYAK